MDAKILHKTVTRTRWYIIKVFETSLCDFRYCDENLAKMWGIKNDAEVPNVMNG